MFTLTQKNPSAFPVKQQPKINKQRVKSKEQRAKSIKATNKKLRARSHQ